MSDTPDFTSASLTSSGYGDGLGRRTLDFDRETGGILERLLLRPELRVFEQAIAERIDQAAAFEDERFARPYGIDRDPESGAVVVVSEHLQGSRLSDLLDGLSGDSAETQAAPGLDAALGFLLEVLPALAALHAAAGFAHGAVGAGRTVMTPGGQVVLLDWVYGHVLSRLGWSRARLWRELGIAAPSAGGPGPVDAAGDIAQAALTAVQLVTGRPLPLEEDEQAEGLAASLPEIVEIAQIRGSETFAAGIERFLHRALLLPGSTPFTSAEEAADAGRRIAEEIGDSACRAALAAFAADSHRAREQPPLPALEDDLSDVVPFEVISPAEEPAEEPIEEPIEEPEIEAGAVAAARVASAALEFEVPLDDVGADDDADAVTGTPAAPADSAPDPVVFDLTAPPPELPAPSPLQEIDDQAPPGFRVLAESEVVDVAPAQPEPVHHEADPAAPAPSEPAVSATPAVEPLAPEPVPGSDPVAAASQPVDSTSEPSAGAGVPRARRKRRKAARNRDAAPAASSSTPPISSPPREVQPPATPAFSPAPPQAAWQTEAPAATPYYPPVSDPREPTGLSWSPPLEPAAPAAGVPSQPAPSTAPVRIRPEKPAGYAPAPRVRDAEPSEDVTGVPYVHRGFAPLPSPRWKIGAAAAAVAAVLIGGVLARQYWPGEKQVEPAAAATATPTAPPQPALAEGGSIALDTKPAGAKVLLDGVPSGETPLILENVPAGRHTVTFVTATGSVKRNIRVEAGQTASVDVAVFSGWVAVFAPVVLDIAENGKSIGTTEQGRLILPPGRHQLTFTNRDLGYSSSQTVDIEPGEERSVNLQPTGTLNLNALPWAEVWIDGKKVGDTPIAGLRLPLGIHDVVFRHPQLGERTMTTTVRADTASAASVDFTKTP
ncbi:MAG: PEGA domain-containing protein [Acidobacteriota bacterium]